MARILTWEHLSDLDRDNLEAIAVVGTLAQAELVAEGTRGDVTMRQRLHGGYVVYYVRRERHPQSAEHTE